MTPENIIKSQVKDYLAMKGIFNFPIMQGLGCQPGLPDRIAVKDGKIYCIECKAPKGVMSPYQKQFRDNIKLSGGVYIEAHRLEDVMMFL